MTNNPLVSVILIFLNEERFLSEAIESVLTQTYRNWELLLVDDGSTDGSTAIAKSYADKFPDRIRYLEHPDRENRGMSASRNLGIAEAKGIFIGFLDGDDLWLPAKLTEQVAILQQHPEAILVCGRTQWWYSWTDREEDRQQDFQQNFDLPLNTVVEPPQVLLMFLRDEWASLCDILVWRSAVDMVGGYETTFPGMYEDQVFHAKLCLRFPVYVASNCWYLYRQHPQACTLQAHAAQQHRAARQKFLIWLEQYLQEQSVKPKEVWQFIRQELWHYYHPRLSKIMTLLHRLKQDSKDIGKLFAKQFLSSKRRFWLKAQWQHKLNPPIGWVRWGSLRRSTPISKPWPNYRGIPIDRYYIEQFLDRHHQDVRGQTLEAGDATYTYRYGGDRITESFILGKESKPNPPANAIYGDLADGDRLPSEHFDTIILTQTLLFIYDLPAAIANLYRMLKPGGTLLVTVPGITPIIDEDMKRWGQYWSFTKMSATKLHGDVFGETNVTVEAYGNVLSATAFLHGLAVDELKATELDEGDPDYELIIGVKAVKPK